MLSNVQQIVLSNVRVSSMEVLLAGFELLSVTVTFSPSVVGCIDAVLRIHLIGTDIRHSVSISCVTPTSLLNS